MKVTVLGISCDPHLKRFFNLYLNKIVKDGRGFASLKGVSFSEEIMHKRLKGENTVFLKKRTKIPI